VIVFRIDGQVSVHVLSDEPYFAKFPLGVPAALCVLQLFPYYAWRHEHRLKYCSVTTVTDSFHYGTGSHHILDRDSLQVCVLTYVEKGIAGRQRTAMLQLGGCEENYASLNRFVWKVTTDLGLRDILFGMTGTLRCQELQQYWLGVG